MVSMVSSRVAMGADTAAAAILAGRHRRSALLARDLGRLGRAG